MPGGTAAQLGGIVLQQFAGPNVGTEGVWLALGTVLMLLGTVYFIARGWNVEDTRQKEFYVITIMITAIASASYLSMFFGFGLTEVEVAGRGVLDIYWARYADWLFTTPLLLLDLGLLARASRLEIGALIAVDAFMIVTGLVGALTKVYTFRFAWWTMSTIAMIVVLYYLFSVLTARARELDDSTQSTFKVLRNLVLVLWSLYPVVWIIGTEGVGVVNLFTETLLFMVLDVTAKVGFGLILLRSRAIVGETEAPEPSATAEAAD